MPSVVTSDLLEHRRRLGIDKSDERWAGEWRIVNPPKNWHVDLQFDLVVALAARVRARGLRAGMENGLFGADDDWRVPDLLLARTGNTYGDAGRSRAELVVEIRSPGDDSYRKLPFYAQHAHEALILHRDRTPELYRSVQGEMVRVAPGVDGAVHCEALDVRLRRVEADGSPRLRITWDDTTHEV